MVFGWWLSLWELCGVLVSRYFCSSYGVAVPFSSFSSSPNSSIGVPHLCPMIVNLKKCSFSLMEENVADIVIVVVVYLFPLNSIHSEHKNTCHMAGTQYLMSESG